MHKHFWKIGGGQGGVGGTNTFGWMCLEDDDTIRTHTHFQKSSAHALWKGMLSPLKLTFFKTFET